MRLLLIACFASALLSAAAPERSDASVTEEIRARFARSKISTNNFHVTVSKGVATITGKTDVVQHKGTATRLAKNCGARQVVNKVEIGQAAREKLAKRLESARSHASPASPDRATAAAVAVAEKPLPPPGTAPPPVRRAQIKH